MTAAAKKLSVIIVNFNTRTLLEACLASLSYDTHSDWEVIVVDNGSSDDSVAWLQREHPLVRTIANRENVGFSAANNQALRIAKGAYLLLLNSDTEVVDDAISSTLAFLDGHREFGAATCRLVLSDGTLDPACHRGFPTPWAALTYFAGLEKLFPRSRLFSRYHMGYRDLTTVHDIDCPSGAFFLLRREVLDSVGPLDEQFFMYGEDIDWAYRMKQNGYRIGYFPGATVIHRKKQSGRSSRSPELQRRIQRYFYETMILFYRKHYHRTYSPPVTWLVTAAIRLRIWLTDHRRNPL